MGERRRIRVGRERRRNVLERERRGECKLERGRERGGIIVGE